MADEAVVRATLSIQKGNVDYRSTPQQHLVDMTGDAKGPTPGAITVATTGTNIDLSGLTTPGLCKLMNLDATNYVEIGTWDGVEFIPMLELGPGEFYIVKLSRNIGVSFGTGTGTTDSGNFLRAKADTAAVDLQVEAFER